MLHMQANKFELRHARTFHIYLQSLLVPCSVSFAFRMAASRGAAALRSIVVVHRHGARAPGFDVMHGNAAFTAAWSSHTADVDKFIVGASPPAPKTGIELEHSHNKDPLAPWGHLTYLGALQTHLRGILIVSSAALGVLAHPDSSPSATGGRVQRLRGAAWHTPHPGI